MAKYTFFCLSCHFIEYSIIIFLFYIHAGCFGLTLSYSYSFTRFLIPVSADEISFFKIIFISKFKV